MIRRGRHLVALLGMILAIGTEVVTAQPAFAQGSFSFSGRDIHDGKYVWSAVNNAYFFYGTQYKANFPSGGSCTFTWRQSVSWHPAYDPGGLGYQGSQWCGFGVWFVTNPSDPSTWNNYSPLFDPNSGDSRYVNTYQNESWQKTCGYSGAGCFNPRMVKRGDGQWILWFNAPGDYARFQKNAYYALTCQGPLGPCGPSPSYAGTITKPQEWYCYGNGDFDIVGDGAGNAYNVCTMADQTLSIEKLASSWTTGDPAKVGNVICATCNNGHGLSCGAGCGVESPSIFSAATNLGTFYYLTYSNPNCGYTQDPPGVPTGTCAAGPGTGYLRSTTLLGDNWVMPSPQNISTHSCVGQPRTLNFNADGSISEWIDQWQVALGNSQGNASVYSEPVTVNGTSGWLYHMADCA